MCILSLTLNTGDAYYFLPSLCVVILEQGFPIPYPLTFSKYKIMYKMADKEIIRCAGTLLCRRHSLTFIILLP